jgi:hypothetical protein
MSATRRVPQTTHTSVKNSYVSTVIITENSGKAYLCVSTVATCKLLTIFPHILYNNNNKSVTLTNAGRNRMPRWLLSKIPIISVNWANIINTQTNCRVATTVSTAYYQYLVIMYQLPSGKHKTFCKFCIVLCDKKVKTEEITDKTYVLLLWIYTTKKGL